MDEELELDLNEDQHINKTEERIKNLSSKVREKSTEAETAKQTAQEAVARAEAAEKKAEFLDSFTTVSSKYQGASEYKDAIQEKVLSGYTVEDATVAVLNANGKLTPQVEVQAPTGPSGPAAGGSAPIGIPSSGDKVLSEMSRDEKRAEVIKAMDRGDIFLS